MPSDDAFRDAVFISHANAQNSLASEIRASLAAHGVDAWVDRFELTGGDALTAEVENAVRTAGAFVVLMSLEAMDSRWVDLELALALEARRASNGRLPIVPILLPGTPKSYWRGRFGEEPLHIEMSEGVGSVQELVPRLLEAIGLAAPWAYGNGDLPRVSAAPAVAELELVLSAPAFEGEAESMRTVASARVTLVPPDGNASPATSSTFQLTSPLRSKDHEELSWYFERYPLWPHGLLRERAKAAEAQFVDWGRALFDALGDASSKALCDEWLRESAAQLRLTIVVDLDRDDSNATAARAGARMMAIPWELLSEGAPLLRERMGSVIVRRRLSRKQPLPAVDRKPPLRVLAVSPRPDDVGIDWVDHRMGTGPLLRAARELGELASVEVLIPPTFERLTARLADAAREGHPFHVLHFDGHSRQDARKGSVALLFEDARDIENPEHRRAAPIDAPTLATALGVHRVSLACLYSCSTAQAEQHPTESVAAKLVEMGLASVVAMSHPVLVETAERFALSFYRALVNGETVGEATLAARSALRADATRGQSFEGPIELHDWFLPVLYQETHDPPLVFRGASMAALMAKHQAHELRLGQLPHPPVHGFLGRSRELLEAERRLSRNQYISFVGAGGEGKTALAAELGRWWVESGRAQRAAFVSLEHVPDERQLLWAVGGQLVPNFESRAARDQSSARLLLQRALQETPTLVVIDNFEALLPAPAGSAAPADPPTGEDGSPLQGVLAFCEELLRAEPTKLVFTSREALPEPFATNLQPTGRMARGDAIRLLEQVLRQQPQAKLLNSGEDAKEEFAAFVDAVGGHARSIVLLAGEASRVGLRKTCDSVREATQRLEERYPNDRERSLIASAKLSLERVPSDLRQKMQSLAVLRGGGGVPVIGMLTELDPNMNGELLVTLRDLGLAQVIGAWYVLFDPALGLLLASDLSDGERRQAEARWLEAMVAWIDYLESRRRTEPRMAYLAVHLDLANLLATAESLFETAAPERTVEVTTALEELLRPLAHSKALARVTELRKEASLRLGEGTRARYFAELAELETLLSGGRGAEAVAAATALLARVRSVPPGPDYEYDIARMYYKLGHAQLLAGNAEASVDALVEARHRFATKLSGNNAAQMHALCMELLGHCRSALGDLRGAAADFEAAVRQAQELGYTPVVETSTGSLASVYSQLGETAKALELWERTRRAFEATGELPRVAQASLEIARIQGSMGHYADAEIAAEQALGIGVRTSNPMIEVAALEKLGELYGLGGYHQGAISFYRSALAIHEGRNATHDQWKTHFEIGRFEAKLGHFEEARIEVTRARKLETELGAGARSWLSYVVTHEVERAAGQVEAAAEALALASERYRSHRTNGGAPDTRYSRIPEAVEGAIRAHAVALQRAHLEKILANPDTHPEIVRMIHVALAIFDGGGPETVSQARDLDFRAAVEFEFILARLGRNGPLLREMRAEAPSPDDAATARQLGAVASSHDSRTALDAYRTATNLDPGDVESWHGLGMLLERFNKLDEAQSAFERLLDLTQRYLEPKPEDADRTELRRHIRGPEQARSWMAMAFNGLGVVARSKGEFDAAERHLDRSITIAASLSESRHEATALGNLGTVHQARGNYPLAKATYERALGLMEKGSDKPGTARLLGNLGAVSLQAGELDDAEKYLLLCFSLAQAIQNQEYRLTALANLGSLCLQTGDRDRAEIFLKRALEAEKTFGAPAVRASIVANLARLHDQEGETGSERE
jgi:tetratricopeptide (TPR) repeat protein